MNEQKITLDEKEGAEAIIWLQALGDTNETFDHALEIWRGFDSEARRVTLDAYHTLKVLFKE